MQQLETLLETSKYILILFQGKDNGDSIAAALALKQLLEKKHKQADIVSGSFTLPKNLGFLPGGSSIKPTLGHLQKFIIKVDVSRAPIETISYDVREGILSIYLTPKHGLLSKSELRTAQSTFKYDLIITLNTPDLESIGEIYFNNTDLFFRTPIINIDHQPNNERYGQINLVDVTTTSASEILYNYIKKTASDLLDGTLATTLLTGMTAATKSFKSNNITPTALHIASELVNLGAEREKIVQNLYHTRSLATLKLWGQALIHLQNDAKTGLVWTTLTREDFTRSGGKSEDIKDVIDEIISNSPEAKVIVLMFESENNGTKKISGIIATDRTHSALELVAHHQHTGNKHYAQFTIENKTLKEAEETLIGSIKTALSNTH